MTDSGGGEKLPAFDKTLETVKRMGAVGRQYVANCLSKVPSESGPKHYATSSHS